MMPSDSGRRRAASGGALERRKTARASSARTPATTRSVLRVRLCIGHGTSACKFHVQDSESGQVPVRAYGRYTYSGNSSGTSGKLIDQRWYTYSGQQARELTGANAS